MIRVLPPVKDGSTWRSAGVAGRLGAQQTSACDRLPYPVRFAARGLFAPSRPATPPTRPTTEVLARLALGVDLWDRPTLPWGRLP